MATLRKRGNVWHIQWYDPIADKITSKSTGLEATESNRKKADQYAKKLQDVLTSRNKELKKIGVKRITIDEAFQHFLKNNQNKHQKTIKDYNRFYKKFTEHFPPDEPCSNITKLKIEEWLNIIKQLPLQQNTIHAYGKQCTHFLNFMFEYNYTQLFKINKEVKTRPEVKDKIIFSVEDIKKIFTGLPDKNENFHTLINVLFYTGLRSSDVLSITCEKINLKERSFSFYSPKRKTHREVAFHEDLLPVLTSIVENQKTGKILNYHNVENLGRAVTRYFGVLGIEEKGYTARTFRKTFITLARSKYNMDASVVKELIGHVPDNTTDKYYNHISISSMKKELKKFKRPGK
jgi:integrase